MPVFPLRVRPAESYHVPPRSFGTRRDGGGRAHAGCDLYAPAGTEILAIADGVIRRGPALFYAGTYSVEVVHPGIGIVRYCEIAPELAPGLKMGSAVKEGQVIATVGRLQGLKNTADAMLHFETYWDDKDPASLSQPGQWPYDRRKDLMDPTQLLDVLPLLSEKTTQP